MKELPPEGFLCKFQSAVKPETVTELNDQDTGQLSQQDNTT